MELCELTPVNSIKDRAQLKSILENHVKYTGSVKAKGILADWENNVCRFIKVIPTEYKKILEAHKN